MAADDHQPVVTSGASRPDDLVVLVHGIWMPALAMNVLSYWLRREGLASHRVGYPFLVHSPAENAERLYEEIGRLDAERIHLVGHSLGGIVILHLLHRHPELELGRIVLLGSPVRGSDVARRVHHRPWTRPLLGRSVEAGLLGDVPEYDGRRSLGIIAGTSRFGVSALLYPQSDTNDGVVRLEETLLDGVADRVEVAHSHSGLIVSRDIARLVARFIKTGRFS